MGNPNKVVEFFPSGRGKAQCAPDPDYPNGIALPCPPSTMVSCKVELPYPAPECGMWRVECTLCKCQILVTAAGRPDDPMSVCMPCITEEAARA